MSQNKDAALIPTEPAKLIVEHTTPFPSAPTMLEQNGPAAFYDANQLLGGGQRDEHEHKR